MTSIVACEFCSEKYSLKLKWLQQYEKEVIPYTCTKCLARFSTRDVLVSFVDNDYPAQIVYDVDKLENVAFFDDLEAWRIPKAKFNEIVKDIDYVSDAGVVGPELESEDTIDIQSISWESKSRGSAKRQKITTQSALHKNSQKIAPNNPIVKELTSGTVYKYFDGVEYSGKVSVDFKNDEVKIKYSDGDSESSSLLDIILEVQHNLLRHSSSFFNGCIILFSCQQDEDGVSYFAKKNQLSNIRTNEPLEANTPLESHVIDMTQNDNREEGAEILKDANFGIISDKNGGTQYKSVGSEFEIYSLLNGKLVKKVFISDDDVHAQLAASHRARRYVSLFDTHGFKEDSHDQVFLAFFVRYHFSLRSADLHANRVAGFVKSEKKFQVFPTTDEEINNLFEFISEDKELHLKRIMDLKKWFDPYCGTCNIEKQVKKCIPGAAFLNNDFDATKHADFNFDSMFYKNFEIFSRDGTLPRNVFTSPPFETMDLSLGLLCTFFDNIVVHCPRKYHANPKRMEFLRRVAQRRDVVIITCAVQGSNKSYNEYILIFKDKLHPLKQAICM